MLYESNLLDYEQSLVFLWGIRVQENASARENHLEETLRVASRKKIRDYRQSQNVASPRVDFRARSRALPLDYPWQKWWTPRSLAICLTAIFLSVFQTSLLSKQTLSEFTTGQVIDLVSNDVQRMELAPMFIYHTVITFFEIPVVTCLVLYLIGWQALMGVLLLSLLIPYLAQLSSFNAELRERTAVVSDQRISFMNEAVSGIRAIKTQAWENEYQDRIKHTRRWEERNNFYCCECLFHEMFKNITEV